MSRRYIKSLDASGLLVYDLVDRKVLRHLSEWGAEMSQKWGALTLALRTDHVVRFLEFLDGRSATLWTATDLLLEQYKEHELKSVMRNPRAIGSVRRAQETVNEKLRTIYGLLEWMQAQELLPPNWVGASGRPAVRVERFVPAERGRSSSRYPKLFRRTGANSRHAVRLHVPRDRFDQAVGVLAAQANPYLAERDSLILDIAEQVGFRRASINSLRVSQFDREQVRSAHADSITIRPCRQKFGYENEFDFPVLLALRVVDFIDGNRRALLDAKGAKGKIRAGDALFLSWKTAEPLTDRTISQITSRAFRAVGCVKGVAAHTGRRLFAVENVEKEIEERLRLGLDTSTASITAAVAIKLGHANPASLHPYVVAALSRRASAQRNARRRSAGGE